MLHQWLSHHTVPPPVRHLCLEQIAPGDARSLGDLLQILHSLQELQLIGVHLGHIGSMLKTALCLDISKGVTCPLLQRIDLSGSVHNDFDAIAQLVLTRATYSLQMHAIDIAGLESDALRPSIRALPISRLTFYNWDRLASLGSDWERTLGTEVRWQRSGDMSTVTFDGAYTSGGFAYIDPMAGDIIRLSVMGLRTVLILPLHAIDFWFES